MTVLTKGELIILITVNSKCSLFLLETSLKVLKDLLEVPRPRFENHWRRVLQCSLSLAQTTSSLARKDMHKRSYTQGSRLND